MTQIGLRLFSYLFFVPALISGCASSPSAPLRSPALDYQPPPPESAADGQPVGADRMSPGDKLQQGASTSGPAPGWSADKAGPKYDPKKRGGGAADPGSGGASSGK